MKTFEAFFTYRIKDAHGSRTAGSSGSPSTWADACVLVQAENVDTAQQKITAAFQRVVDGETPKEAPPIERGHARLGWVAPVETPLDEVRKASEKPEVHAPPVAHQPAPKPEIKPGAFENALNFVRTTPPAISGKGGHAHTFSVARMLVESPSLSDSDIWTLLLEFNQRCEPPWSEMELRHKLNRARGASGMVDVAVPMEPDPWIPIVAAWLRKHEMIEVSLSEVMEVIEGAMGSKSNTVTDKRMATILRGLGYEPLRFDFWRYRSVNNQLPSEVAAVRRWLLSPRSGSYKRPYPKNPKLAPKTEPLTESELEALRVDATSLGSDGVLHFTKRDPLVLRLLDEHANMKMMLASSAEESSGSTESPVTYKLRTECWADTIRLLREVHADRVTIDGDEVTLENPRGFGGDVLSIEKLRELIRNFPDSHVMTETLSVADTYTGERTRTQEQT